MNNQRRKEIAALLEAATGEGGLQGQMSSLHDQIEQVMEEEQEYFDTMPESFQQGERGSRAEEVICALEEAMGVLDSIDFDEITSTLDEAMI